MTYLLKKTITYFPHWFWSTWANSMMQFLIMLPGCDLSAVVRTRVWSNITRAWTAELGRQLVGFVPSFRWVLPNPWTGSRPLVPTPVETEEVITPEECCFSLNKQRLALSQLMARGRGRGSSCSQRTPHNRIMWHEKCRSPTDGILTNIDYGKNDRLQQCKVRAVYARYSLLGHMTTPTLRVLLSFAPLSRIIEKRLNWLLKMGDWCWIKIMDK